MAAPSAAAVARAERVHCALRPLGAREVRVEGGFWGRRQQVNREVTLRVGAEQLEETGRLQNLRVAAGRATGAYQGARFNDSDVYKWLEALGWELARAPSAELSRLARETIELIAAAQLEDGYLNSYCQLVDPAWRYSDLAMGHELYCAGHLIQAAVAHTRGTGDETLLGVARGFADHIESTFGEGRREGLCGHPEIEMALVELQRLTGEERYLRLASVFVERRGRGLLGPTARGADYFQDAVPVREASALAGHAVRALYLGCGVTDVALETGDESLLEAAIRLWDDVVSAKTYLTGGIGSRHWNESIGDPYELPPDRAYCETCAAVASVMWSWRLLLATGEARYADLIERTLFNGFLAGVSLDGREFFYVNPLRSRGGHERGQWFEVACCPPNLMRLLSSLEHYVATATDDGVQLHQYASSTIRTSGAGGGALELHVATAYPWEGTIELSVAESGPEPWTLSLRVPSWCDAAALRVNDAEIPLDRGFQGYATVSRSWRRGDLVVLELPLRPRLTAPHPRIDAVRGCVALERGPLVYCLEEVDQPSGADLADVAIAPDGAVDATDRPDLLGGVVAIEVSGVVSGHDGRSSWPYRDAATQPEEAPPSDVRLTAIPYFAWANRGAGAMRVWIPRATEKGGRLQG